MKYIHEKIVMTGLMLSLVGALMVLPQGVVAQGASQEQHTEVEIVRERFTDELLAPSIDHDEIRRLIGTVRDDGSWPGINYEDTSRTAFEHSRHLTNMVKLGRAYRKQGSIFYGNAELQQVIGSSLDFWLEHDFICENWWWNQIGTPERIGDLLLIMDEELTDQQKEKAAPIVGRANLDAWGARPGGDLIKIAGIMGKYAMFKKDNELLQEALEAIAGEIGFAVDRGDTSDVRGLQTDYSFHHRHDRVTSTLTYGHGFARYFVDWADKVSDTAFRFPDESVELLVDFYLDGITHHMAYGRYPDPGAKNRGITRRGALSSYGAELPEKLLRVTSYRQDELEALAQVRRDERTPENHNSQFFWHTEYYSHQRPDYFTSVRMYSSRNHNMEVPYNGEGLKNHHLGDGYTFITRTGEEYKGIFPVWDWQKIPGTTVVQKSSLPDPDDLQQPGQTEFVGGVTDGRYGAAVFDFESPIDPLSARKSWFFFDDEFVALGTAIEAESDDPVATTLNQSLLNGAVVWGKEGEESELDQDTHELDEVDWVHHDQTGYLFTEPADVHLSNRSESGSWQQINDQSWARDLGKEEQEVFTLWLDHGVAPRQAEYEYIVVPGIPATEVGPYQKNSPIEMISNTPGLQAVRHRELGRTQMVFYEEGEAEIGEGLLVSTETPGLVMVKTAGDQVEAITVSDPTRQLDALRLHITAPLEGEGERWKATWHEEAGYSSIQVTLPDGEYAGQSVMMEL